MRWMKARSALQTVISLALVALLLLGCGPTAFLNFVEVQREGVGEVTGLNRVWSVTVSPDGEHVYATGYLDDALVVFSRDGTTGKLTLVEVQRDGVGGVEGLAEARSVAVSPDGEGKHLYVVSKRDNAVAVFSVLHP